MSSRRRAGSGFTADVADAIGLKEKLVETANAQPQGDKEIKYDAPSQMAEWPVFFAYAMHVGPICVYSVPAGSSRSVAFFLFFRPSFKLHV